jgi:hypothetical protein
MMGMAERVTSADVDRFSKMLTLTKEQREAVQGLFEAYTKEYDQADKVRQDAIEKARQEFEDTHDPSVWSETLPAEMQKFGDKVAAMETTLMSDIKTLLTADQASKWPQVEHSHRRTKSLPSGMLSGESIDLIALVDDLKLKQPLPESISQPLTRYETELDQALQVRDDERKELAKELPGFGGGNRNRQGGGGGGGAGGMCDFEAIGKTMAAMRKSGLKVRDINDRYAGIIGAALPEASKATFEEKYNIAKFPGVYREPYVLKAIDAAAKFDDLDKTVKQSLTDLAAAYERDAAIINDKWAKAIATEEKEGGGDPMGGFMRMMGGGEAQDDSPQAQARKDRRNLDNQTMDKLKALLTPAQQERLPSRESTR